MKALSLFSGIGGLDIAAQACGIEPVAFCEIEPFPVEILKKRFPSVPILPDVRKVNGHDFGTVDVIFGGFPCQDLSVAGRRVGLLDKSGNATRSGLWFEMLRIISEARPRFVVAENVRGAVRLALDTVTDGLEAEGYTVRAALIPASAVGAPHQRERLFIIGIRNDVRELAYADKHDRQRLSDDGKNGESWSQPVYGYAEHGSSSGFIMAYADAERLQGRTGNGDDGEKRKKPTDERLGICCESRVWSPPDANADRGAMSEELYQRRIAEGKPININAQVAHEERNWPMCTASGNERSGSTQYKVGSNHSANLGNVIDEVEGKRKGQLNPAWVEQLMGYPDGWTDLDCEEPKPWKGWPARPGEAQKDFEHSRTVTGMKNRAKRLKALGNSVVPQQAEPIFRTVQLIDELTREK